MGDFEFEVTLDEGEGLELPPPTPMTVVPDHIEQLVDEESLKSGIQLLDEEEITGGDAFQTALFGEGASEEKPADPVKMDSQANPFEDGPSQDEQKMMEAAHLLDAFMTGLDITRAEIHPSTPAGGHGKRRPGVEGIRRRHVGPARKPHCIEEHVSPGPDNGPAAAQ